MPPPPSPAAPIAERDERPDSAPAAASPPLNGNAPEETNVWPDDAAESAFLSESRQRGEPPTVPRVAEVDEPEPAALPPLETLVNRIPAETRELLDELFRARFTTVRRVKKSDLQA